MIDCSCTPAGHRLFKIHGCCQDEAHGILRDSIKGIAVKPVVLRGPITGSAIGRVLTDLSDPLQTSTPPKSLEDNTIAGLGDFGC